jgi:hypothetical protein
MATSIEKRSYKRCTCRAPTWVSYSNTESAHEVLTINYGEEGLCVKSNIYFQPGTPLLIKSGCCAPKAHGAYTFEGLPTVVHAEVKWCRKISDPIIPSYTLGVKYYAPYY